MPRLLRLRLYVVGGVIAMLVAVLTVLWHTRPEESLPDAGAGRSPRPRRNAVTPPTVGPSPDGATTGPGPAVPRAASPYPLYAIAYPRFDVQYVHARVFRRPRKAAVVVGHVRRGGQVRVKPAVGGRGCPGGRWHPVQGGGFLCTSKGFTVSHRPLRFRGRQRPPTLNRNLPFLYGKVTRRGAPLLRRRPTFKEILQLEEATAGKAPWPAVVLRPMNGIYLLALDRLEWVGDQPYYRTVRGRYVHKRYIARKQCPRLRGAHLRGRRRLPLAFVFGGAQPRYRLRGKKLEQSGTLPKYHRFPVRKEQTVGKKRMVVGAGGIAVERRLVRIARTIRRPVDIPAGERWVHVDLGEQTLTAYQGTEPVFATLVSTGKQGYRTRRGLYRIEKKYFTHTMDATDPIDGFYRIEEVPWTMYYWRSFAVHGAYWHDDFGKTRSHGCVNLSPADARWLFGWTRPEIPPGWHGRRRCRGTSFYFTR